MRLYDGGALLIVGVLLGLLIGNINNDPKGEIETKEPVKEEVYESGLYEKSQ